MLWLEHQLLVTVLVTLSHFATITAQWRNAALALKYYRLSVRKNIFPDSMQFIVILK